MSHLIEVSRQFLWTTRISSHPLLQTQMKWKNPTKAWNACCALNYQKHKWLLCGDCKVVGLILGLQGVYAKYAYFLCWWDCRADDQHYVTQEWPSIQGLKPGYTSLCLTFWQNRAGYYFHLSTSSSVSERTL